MYLNKTDGSHVIKKVYLSCPVKCYFFSKSMRGWLKCVIQKEKYINPESLPHVFTCFRFFFLVFFFYTKQTNKMKRNPQVIHSLQLLSDVNSELHG